MCCALRLNKFQHWGEICNKLLEFDVFSQQVCENHTIIFQRIFEALAVKLSAKAQAPLAFLTTATSFRLLYSVDVTLQASNVQICRAKKVRDASRGGRAC